MTTENHDPAETAEIDQLLTGFGARLDGWVSAMQTQVTKRGPDQALANVMLALSIERMNPAELTALFVIALQRLATPPPTLTEDPGPDTDQSGADAAALNQIAMLLRGEEDLSDEDVRSAICDIVGTTGRITDAGPEDEAPDDSADYTIDPKP